MSQRAAARRLGVSWTFLADILHRRRSCPPELAYRIEALLGIDADVFEPESSWRRRLEALRSGGAQQGAEGGAS